MSKPWTRATAVAVGMAVALSVAGCAAPPPGAPGPTGSASVRATPSQTPSAAPSPTAGGLVIPPCDNLYDMQGQNTLQFMQTMLDDTVRQGTPLNDPASLMDDAVATQAIAQATKVEGCQWQGDPRHVSVVVAVLPEPVRDTLVTTLQNSGKYPPPEFPDTSDNDTVLSATTEDGTGISYLFAGDFWIIVRGTEPPSGASHIAEVTATQLRAANPQTSF